MLSQCTKKVAACTDSLTGETVGNPDFPFRNLSSEAPETTQYRSFQPWTPPVVPTDDPVRFFTPGCISLCSSVISQEEADLCAERQAIICAGSPGGGTGNPGGEGGGGWGDPNPTNGGGGGGVPGGGGPGPGGGGVPPPGSGENNPPPGGTTPPPGGGTQIFYSAEKSCSETCPDGSTFTKIIPAGQFVDFTQERADARAAAYACQQAKALRICLSDLTTPYYCIHQDVEIEIAVSGQNGPYTVTVTGSIPDGLVMESNATGTIMTLTGQITSAGDYAFTIRAEDRFGNVQTKDYSVTAIGIRETSLPDGKIACAYSKELTTDGMTGPIHWGASGLPAGLTIDSVTGIISGTLVDHGAYKASIDAIDAEGRMCGAYLDLYIWDCNESFSGSEEFKVQTDQSYTVPIPPALCDRTIHILTNDIRFIGDEFCNPVGQVVMNLYKDGVVTQSTKIVSTFAPHPPSMDSDAWVIPGDGCTLGEQSYEVRVVGTGTLCTGLQVVISGF